jgi:hypothetical protein
MPEARHEFTAEEAAEVAVGWQRYSCDEMAATCTAFWHPTGVQSREGAHARCTGDRLHDATRQGRPDRRLLQLTRPGSRGGCRSRDSRERWSSPAAFALRLRRADAGGAPRRVGRPGRRPRPILIIGRRQLERVLRVYVRHHNERRPHRALGLRAPDKSTAALARGDPIVLAAAVRRRDLLAGLIP